MAVATFEFDCPQGYGTGLRVEARAIGSNDIAANGASSNSTEYAGDLGGYTVTFTDLASGTYKIRVRTVAGNVTIARGLLNHSNSAVTERPAMSDQAAIANPTSTVNLSGTTVGGISGGGTGARTVTVTVQTSGAVAIQGALVRLTKGAESFTQSTNASGQCTFNVNDGTWTVSIIASGYSFSGASLVVDGTETPTYTMTTNTTSAPADPAFCTLAIRCWNTSGVVAAGVSVKVKVSSPPTGTGEMFSNAETTVVTGADGYARFTVPRGCSVIYWVSGNEKKIDKVGTSSGVVYVDNWLGA